MQAEATEARDWRDADAYAPLLYADRTLFAWEWLRRNRIYCAAASACPARDVLGARGLQPLDFGLLAFEPPERGVPMARPLWSASSCAFVLTAGQAPLRHSGDRFPVDELRRSARVLTIGETDHWLLSDGLRAIRVDAPREVLAGRSGGLCFTLAGLASAEPPLLALRRLIALCRTGRFARSLHRREVRAHRWILALRAFDALAAGADQRQIAEVLLSRTAVGPRWRSEEPSLRTRAQRLVRDARQLSAGGYRRLLSPARSR